MTGFIISFLSGFVVSFIGSIVPGSMSATVIEITIKKNRKAGLLFGLGASLVEMIYIRLYFFGFDYFVRQKELFNILQWIMVCFFFVFGIYTFIRSYRKKSASKKRKSREPRGPWNAFLLGVILKGLSPTQFVFWTLWSSYLITNKFLKPNPTGYTFFCIGLGLATFAAYVLYVYLGEWMETKSIFKKGKLDRIVGAFLVITSILWVAKLIWF